VTSESELKGPTRRRFAKSMAILAFGSGIGSGPARAAEDLSLLAPEIQAIKRRGKLIVGMTHFDSPPFYYAKRGASADSLPVGFDVELASEIATALQVELAFDRRAEDFNRVVEFVTRGEVDVATSKLSLTLTRAVRVAFARPTIELRHALLANRVRLASLENGAEARSVINHGFAGSIAVIAGSSFADIARQLFARASVHELKSWSDVVEAVNTGAVDMAYRDELEIKRQMRVTPELHLNVRSVLISDRRDYVCTAAPASSNQLVRLVDAIIMRRRRLDANQLLESYAEIFDS